MRSVTPSEDQPDHRPGIAVDSITKTFGQLTAVNELSFHAGPGEVTAFLGPNGSGKSTTLRMILGLIKPDSGTAVIDGSDYVSLSHPTRSVGAVLDAGNMHPGCTGWDHLSIYARTGGYGRKRVAAVIDELELGSFVTRRTGGYSTGMKQRLSLATALLGDPHTLILDEPSNGLDPHGIAWLRRLVRRQADEGRTILISSHMLSEVQQVADKVVMIKNGTLLGAGTVAELSGHLRPRTYVRTDQPQKLINTLRADTRRPDGFELEFGMTPEQIILTGIDAEQVAALARSSDVLLTEISNRTPGLEDLFLELTLDRTDAETPPDVTADDMGSAK